MAKGFLSWWHENDAKNKKMTDSSTEGSSSAKSKDPPFDNGTSKESQPERFPFVLQRHGMAFTNLQEIKWTKSLRSVFFVTLLIVSKVHGDRMIQVAILKRRLKAGKTYEDFRKVWFHTVGFGTANKMLTVINAADPREIIVIGINETSIEQLRNLIDIDSQQRAENPLDEIIEPEIDRTFGVLVAEDDFSATGELGYQEARVNGNKTDFGEVSRSLEFGAKLLAEFQEYVLKKPL